MCALEGRLVLNWEFTVLQRVWFAPGCGGMGRKEKLPELRAGLSCKDTFASGEPASLMNSGSRDGGPDSDFITKGGDTVSGVD